MMCTIAAFPCTDGAPGIIAELVRWLAVARMVADAYWPDAATMKGERPANSGS
jgi:hypothetical protein